MGSVNDISADSIGVGGGYGNSGVEIGISVYVGACFFFFGDPLGSGVDDNGGVDDGGNFHRGGVLKVEDISERHT